MIQLTPLDKTVAGQELIHMGIDMTLKEVQKIIQPAPVDKTVFGKELIQMGIDEGILKGIEKDIRKGRTERELIGKIHATQRFLNRRPTPKKKLLAQSPKELRAILKQLEAMLN